MRVSQVEALSASERISRVIFDYAARIGQEQDPDALLRLNANMARDLVGAERCSIWLVDSATSTIHTTVAHGVGEIRVELGHGLVGACIADAKPIVVNDTSTDQRFLSRIDQETGYATHCVMAVPLRAADGNVLGAFQALNKPGGFSTADVTLLGLAGSFSAAAIETQRLRQEAEKARIFLRELEVAREVQAGLLPRGDRCLERLESATFFRPAKLVGGDYYDLIETPGGGLAFTLGDVSGKGLPAAVFMASIQASLRIPLLRGPESLVELVASVNDSVHASSSAGRYSTLFCGLIDPKEQRLTYVNAGQCEPVLVRRRGDGVTLERLSAGGMPIGLFAGATYEEGTIPLDPGDLLVCYSDGISEAENVDGQMWAESGIEAVLRETAGLNAKEVTDRVVQGAETFAAGAEQADDMTVVTLRILEPGERDS